MKSRALWGILVLVVIIAGTAAIGILSLKHPTTPPASPISGLNLNQPLPPPPTPEEIPAEESSSDATAESVTPEPVPYFPPPSTNLTGGKLGNQVVPGTDGIGDIWQLYYQDASGALYMTVTEPDATRSVWRLDQHGKLARVFAGDHGATDGSNEIRIMGDGKGVMYVELNNPDRVYRTSDEFKTWQLVMSGKGIFWNIASDNRGNVYGALHSFNEPLLYRSPDNGFSWEPWVDFSKVFPEFAKTYADGDPRFMLRHLHDVIYDDKTDALIVGVGDVARFAVRSDDDGKTWQKIWDEGFTAHVALGGGDRYLLCPDKLRGPGIALYDAWGKTTTQVFDPGLHGYAGYCYSVINVNGIDYASFHTEANEVDTVVPRSGVVVSPDGVNWYTFLDWDPLTNHARTNIWLASAPARVYASINGRLYAFAPLDQDWFKDKAPLSAN